MLAVPRQPGDTDTASPKTSAAHLEQFRGVRVVEWAWFTAMIGYVVGVDYIPFVVAWMVVSLVASLAVGSLLYSGVREPS